MDLIEEEEEEWPEAGAQNVEEAEQYVQKINNVFEPPFNINTRRYEDSFRPNNQKLQEDSSEAVGHNGGC